jgi:putative hemin transport protein
LWPAPGLPPLPASADVEGGWRALRRQAGPALKAGEPLEAVAAAMGVSAAALAAAHAGVFDPAESPLKARRLQPDAGALWALAAPLLAGGRLQVGGGALSLDTPASAPGLALLQPEGAAVAEVYALDRRLAGDAVQRRLVCFDAAGTPLLGLEPGPQTAWAPFYAVVRRLGQPAPRPDGATAAAGAPLLAPVAGARLDPGAGWELLARAAQAGLPLKLTVGNAAVTWSHTGAIAQLVLQGRWLCLRSGETDLRLDEQRLHGAWCQRHTGRPGLRHTLHLQMTDGSWLALADAAEAGRPETCAWRLLVQSLWPADQPGAAACLR